jgi:hypothetical protein
VRARSASPRGAGALQQRVRLTPTVRGCGSAFARDAERGARPLGKKNRGLLPAACGTAVASPPTPPSPRDAPEREKGRTGATVGMGGRGVTRICGTGGRYPVFPRRNGQS